MAKSRRGATLDDFFLEVVKKNVNYLNLCALKIIFVEICKISDA
jgi:hypothetical protein